jgi:hypothetical protein
MPSRLCRAVGPDRGVGPAAKLGHDQPPGVADEGRIDVLVAPLDPGHAAVDPTPLWAKAERPT